MKVGPIRKTLRVTGDRVCKVGALTISNTAPEPFERMPLTYERAYGGRDETADDPKKHSWEVRNPVGVGFAVRSSNLADKPLPNVEEPGRLLSRPAGVGPIAAHWQ